MQSEQGASCKSNRHGAGRVYKDVSSCSTDRQSDFNDSHIISLSVPSPDTMLFSSLAVVAAATAALASPVKPSGKTVALPVKRSSNVKSAKSLVEKGHARLNKINGVKTVGKRDSSGSVTNDDVSYIAAVTIGDGTYNLIVDTGCKSLLTSQTHTEQKE